MSVSKANSLVGSPIERIEDLRFLRGRGEFVDDIVRDGLLHAAILRSSIAHGRINAVDTSAALARSGVHAVITAADVVAALGAVPAIPLRQEQMPAFKPYEQPAIAHGKVRYVGEPVAVVIADSAAIAEDALDAIALDITPLPVAAGRQTPDALLVESTGTNCAATLTAVRGDIDAAFKDAPYVRRERFRVQRHTAVPMEARGLLAEWDASRGNLTVYGAAKVAFAVRRILADQFSLPEDAITMLEGDVGGAFGVRGEFYPEDFLIPFAARTVGRPVKWIEDRREHLTATNHARDVECEVEIACDRDGTIRGLRGHAHADVGAYLRTNGATGARNVAQVLSGPYSIPNIRIDVSIHEATRRPLAPIAARAVRSGFLPRAAVGDDGARSRTRSGRVPPAQSDRRSPDAVRARHGRAA
jgi:carbon-monoxide dehydrogenase large subunit